tara:strand:+ start:615 stop:1046 length:432 start_codon:yes stop_codon:yes gene_type:complete
MASNHKHPENDVAWFIVGDKLAIITTKGTDSSSVHSKAGDWKAIDEAVSNGVLIHYYAEPNTVDELTDYPDIDNAMHANIVDYVKSKLYIDRAGNAADPNASAVAMNLAMVHEKQWRDALVKFGTRRRDKIGGLRSVRTYDLR